MSEAVPRDPRLALIADSYARLLGQPLVDSQDDLAEALWQILREEPIEGAGTITASFGVTDWRAGESAASMLTRVDAAVYQAKQEGRDRVVIAP